MMNYAHQYEAPIAIRYPKGNLPEESEDAGPQIRFGQGYLVREEKDAFCLLLALGVCRKMAEEAAEQLVEKGIRVSVADARFVAPLSREWLLELSRQYPRILTIEDHIHTGGFGIKVRDLLAEERAKSQVRILALPDRFIEQGKREVLLSRYGISVEGIQKAVENWNAEA